MPELAAVDEQREAAQVVGLGQRAWCMRPYFS
jgi:hypothetical protein